MQNFIAPLVICALVFAVESHQSLPDQNVITNCSIPNESEPGECQYPGDCPAFQEINDVASLGNVSRISFVRHLQCAGTEEGKVCCPRGRSYTDPWINVANMTRRVRNKPILVRKRTQIPLEVPCGVIELAGLVSDGMITNIDEFPWTTVLIYEKAMDPVASGCGGALISNSFVVTAAHCLVGRVLQKLGALKFVRVGEYNLANPNPDCVYVVHGNLLDCNEETIDLRPKRIIVHPDYRADNPSHHHDIGLIELEHPVEFTDFVRHICLPEMGSGKMGPKFSVCGWGRTDFFRNGTDDRKILSPIKLRTSLPHVDRGACSEVYQSQSLQLIDGQICAGGSDARDTCYGDSGSPLMFFDTRKQVWILTGLVSIGPQNCGTVGKPGIYTNINKYVQWIKTNAFL